MSKFYQIVELDIMYLSERNGYILHANAVNDYNIILGKNNNLQKREQSIYCNITSVQIWRVS